MAESAGRKTVKQMELLPVTLKERTILILKGVLAVLVLDYFFYRAFWTLIPLAGLGFVYYRMEEKRLMEKKRQEVRSQFKELMLLTSTGQRAGYSVDNAFLGSYQHMCHLYGPDSTVCRMLSLLRAAKENNVSSWEVWKSMAEKLQIQEIADFAVIYKLAQAKSGNTAEIMEKTAKMIVERIETEKETALLISARRLEQRIMNVMPFVIILYIQFTSPDYFNVLYCFPEGTLLMTLAMGVYLGAYFLSVRLIAFKI